MKVEKDYEEFLRLLNRHKVRYCIIGAYAVAFYARPRYTKDIDILVEPCAANAKKLLKALNEFGFKSLHLKESDFCEENKIIQLGYEPIRLDLITSIEGYCFKEVWENKSYGVYGNEKAYFIGLDELVKTKKIAARKQDKADIDILLSVKKRK